MKTIVKTFIKEILKELDKVDFLLRQISIHSPDDMKIADIRKSIENIRNKLNEYL